MTTCFLLPYFLLLTDPELVANKKKNKIVITKGLKICTRHHVECV
jgi:hypothetical protein